MIGKVLDNRYELVEQIGQGGMALVYRAIDRRTGHSVAVKILRPELNQDQEYFNRFQREAIAVSKMNHHNIVNLLDVGQQDNMRYLVMEYVNGRTLKEVIRQKGPLSPNVAAQIGIRILSALQHAHKNGIIHRDIKPQNILVHADGHIKVADFGIARVVGANTISSKDSVMGSAQYLSPEQAKGETVGFASDLYSVGVVMYEMLTGKPPYQGDTHVAVALQHIGAKAKPIHEINPDVPAALEKVVDKAMEKRPENRYQSAVEMAQDLQRAMQEPSGDWIVHSTDQPISSLVQTGRQQPVNKTRKKWAVILQIAFICLVIAGLVIGGILIYDQVANTTEAPLCLYETEADAVHEIVKKGLKEIITRRSDEEIAAGTVISQSPEYGTPMRKGDTVELVISTGPAEKEAPSIIGMDVEEARTELNRLGFTLLVLPERQLSGEPWNTVLEQNPKEGEPISTGSVVEVTLSGSCVSVIGKSLEEARAELSTQGFTLLVLPERQLSEEPWDTVLDQNPQPGELVNAGSVVEVTLSGGCVTLPNLVDTTRQEAEKTIQELNLDLVEVWEYQVEDPTKEGLVCSQQYRDASFATYAVGDQVMQQTQVILGVYTCPADESQTEDGAEESGAQEAAPEDAGP